MLTPAGYILLDGTPYDPVKRKQENERRKAAKRKKQPKQQEAAAADDEEEDDVEDDVEDEEDEDDEAPPSPLPSPPPPMPPSPPPPAPPAELTCSICFEPNDENGDSSSRSNAPRTMSSSSDCLALLCLAIASCSRSLIAARSCHVLRRDDFEEFALEDAP